MQAIKNSKSKHQSEEPNFKYLTCLFLGKASVLADVVPQITSRHEVDNEIEVVSVFEGVVHIHKEAKEINDVSLNLKCIK